MGHKGIISGDEGIISILVANQLKKTVYACPTMINGFATDFKIVDNQGLEIFFEIKPGQQLCNIGRKSLEKAFQLAHHQLMIEQQNLGIENVGVVFDCSESPFEIVVKLRELILKNNFSSNILLTHKLEADYLKQLILQNKNGLQQY